MARFCAKFLDKDEEELVNAKSLECLERIGVAVHSPSVLRMLEGAGATIDEKKGVAKMPESIVSEALKKAPKSFRLCARDERKDVILPAEGYPYISTNGLSVYTTDIDTGEKRPTTSEDLAMYAKLADALDEIGFFWPQVTATEVFQPAHAVHELWVSLQNGTKHVQGDAVSAADARAQIEIGALVAGGKDDLRKRPIFSVTCCPIAPLLFERGSVEAQVEFAKAGVPISSMSMSLSGMSAPMTIAATIVNANTENLASIVITQTANPGSPHVYASESTPIDMATGAIDYNANECPLIAAALAQMAKRYGFPCMVGQWGADGDNPGLMTSFNELATVGLTMLSGTDMCSGMGGLESAKGASLEQLVIDAMLWKNFKPVLRKMAIDDEHIPLDIVEAVGHGSSYLTHPHTAKNFRKELFFRDKKTRSWEATLSSVMVGDAKDMARKLLKEHEVPQLDNEMVKRGNMLIEEFEKSLKA